MYVLVLYIHTYVPLRPSFFRLADQIIYVSSSPIMSEVTKGKEIECCRIIIGSPEIRKEPCEMKDWSRNPSYLRLWGQLYDVYLERNL